MPNLLTGNLKQPGQIRNRRPSYLCLEDAAAGAARDNLRRLIRYLKG